MVSVIIPCYNQAHFLAESVGSVLAQSYENWECIIVDDGSTDNTAKVAKRLCENDERIKYLHRQNAGLPTARNTGIVEANGQYILPLDADDLIMPTYLATTTFLLDNEKSIRLVYTDTQLFGIEKGVRDEEFSMESFLLNNLIPCTALFFKEDWLISGRYNETMINGYEDWDFWMSLFEKGICVKKIPELLFHYRRVETSMSKKMDSITIEKIQKELYVNHADLYLRILGNPLTLSLKIRDLQRQLALIQKSNAYELAMKISSIINFISRLIITKK